jgi:N-formylglutamate amidohydrolase
VEPFDVFEPRAGESAVVVEVPHAGLAIDPESAAFTIAPARSIARDADLLVDELCQDAPNEGATLLVANMSRFVVDLNRSPTDYDADAVEGGGRTPWPRGLVWRLTTDGDPMLEHAIPRAELERRLDRVYRPYHRTLQGLLERKLERFGHVVLLCAHSMPSYPRPSPSPRVGRTNAPASPGARADLVPGTRGRTSAAGQVIDLVDAVGNAHGFTIRHDDPYRGGFSTAHYGRPAHGVHAVQIEIARRLYMDETSLRIDVHGFRAVREFARTLAARLAFAESDAPNRKLRRDHAAASVVGSQLGGSSAKPTRAR